MAVLFFVLPACAPRAVVRPISPDTPPDKVLGMVKAADEGIMGLKASVKVTVQAEGKNPESMDGVLYVGRPDRVRLTGLAMLGFTVFDISLTGEKFYFYQPQEGYLYTGPRAALSGFLETRGVKADPDVLYRSLFVDSPGEHEKYVVEKTEDGYSIYIAGEMDGILTPRVRADYDPGLSLRQRVFYDGLARPYLYVQSKGQVVEGGFRLPAELVARDIRDKYTVSVSFGKYMVNPEGLDSEFTIQGGEFKGIREIQAPL